MDQFPSASSDCIYTARVESPLGPLMVAASAQGICLLEFDDMQRVDNELSQLNRLLGLPIVAGENQHLMNLRNELEQYFDGQLKQFSLPLVYPGSDFQQRVWTELLKVPYAETRSYEELAIAVGSPLGVRAVGTANGANRIAILIPCHRVLNKNGRLGGYGGGLWRKNALLQLEMEHINS
jgi:AraC family transcriptional regulator, regulatory protein of adaptative response / methylated-DNA-[protein]-cysteine methyltransferase